MGIRETKRIAVDFGKYSRPERLVVADNGDGLLYPEGKVYFYFGGDLLSEAGVKPALSFLQSEKGDYSLPVAITGADYEEVHYGFLIFSAGWDKNCPMDVVKIAVKNKGDKEKDIRLGIGTKVSGVKPSEDGAVITDRNEIYFLCGKESQGVKITPVSKPRGYQKMSGRTYPWTKEWTWPVRNIAGIDSDFRSVIVSEKDSGEVAYKFEVEKDKRYIVAFGFCEGKYEEEDKRILDLKIEDKVIDTIDPVKYRHNILNLYWPEEQIMVPRKYLDRKNVPLVKKFEVTDEDNDGFIKISVAANPDSFDKIAYLNCLWLFEDTLQESLGDKELLSGSLNRKALCYINCGEEESQDYLEYQFTLKSNEEKTFWLKKPHQPVSENDLTRIRNLCGDNLLQETINWWECLLSEGTPVKEISTNNPQHNRLIMDVLDNLVLNNWVEARSPEALSCPSNLTGGVPLPYDFIQASRVGWWPNIDTWDVMFILNFYASCGNEERIRNLFKNYWFAVENNPLCPKGTPGYGMPPHGIPQIISYTVNTGIFGWGTWMIYLQNNDRELLKQNLPYLVALDKWYVTERDIDNDLLIEVGSYHSGNVTEARYELFDLHPSFDMLKMTDKKGKTGTEKSFYGNVDTVGETAFVISNEEHIAKIASVLGKEDIAVEYADLAERRRKALQKIMWDDDTEFFYDIDRDTHELIRCKTFWGLLPLFAGGATRDQAQALVKHLTNPEEFWTPYPIPSASKDDPKFMTSFLWSEGGLQRGDVWPPVNYLISLGLHRYGYHEVAEELAKRTYNMIRRSGINERYHPLTGERMGFPDVSMTGAVLNMMYQNFYGLQDDYRTILMSDEYWGRRLTLGAVEVEYALDRQVKLRTAFSRRFNIILSKSWEGKEITVNLVDGNGKIAIPFEQKDKVITFIAHCPATKREKSYYQIAVRE